MNIADFMPINTKADAEAYYESQGMLDGARARFAERGITDDRIWVDAARNVQYRKACEAHASAVYYQTPGLFHKAINDARRDHAKDRANGFRVDAGAQIWDYA